MLALFLCLKEVNAMPYIPKDQIATAREMDGPVKIYAQNCLQAPAE